MSRRRSRNALALAAPPPTPIREEKARVEPRIGYSGTPESLGRIDVEYHPDLEDLEKRIARFNEIRVGNASIVAAIEKLWWPIARGTWSMDASEQGNQRAEDAAELMRANILRAGAPGSEAYRMITPWSQFLWECFTAEQFGFSIHEKIMRVQPGPLGTFKVYHHLAWIHPSSIWQFRRDRDGQLLGIIQRFQARWWEGEKKDASEKSDYFDDFIPAENLFVRTRKKEGSNDEGTALLRGMYADAKRNQSMMNWQAIHAQRVAVGIPRVKILDGAPPEVQARAIDMAKLMRGGAQDRIYAVESPGVEVGWVKNDTGALDLSAILRAGEDRTRGVASLEWAGLGQAGSAGSRAVGDVQQRPFWLQVEGIAEGIAEDIQTNLVEPGHRLNFADVAPPRTRVADVSPIAIADIALAAQAGLVVFTAQDSNDLRRTLKLRTLSQEEMEEQDKLFLDRAKRASAKPEPNKPQPKDEEPEDEPSEKPEAKAKPSDDASGDEGLDAELGAVELAAKPKREPRPPTEFETKHCAIDTIRNCFDELEREAEQSLRAARDMAVDEALANMTIRGTRVTVLKPKKAAKAIEAALRAIAEKARNVGRETAKSEIQSQMADALPKRSLAQRAAEALGLAERPEPFDPFAPAPPRKRGLLGRVAVSDAISEELETVIGLNVESVLDAVVKGVKREMLSGLASEMIDEEAVEAARRAIKDYSVTPLKGMGREIASRGINGGRAEVAEEAIDGMEGSDYAIEYATRSAVLDNNTCGPCEELDGTEVEVASDSYFALMPPARCDGGAWCRCFYTFAVGRKAA